MSRVILYKSNGEKFKVLLTSEVPNVNDVLHIGSKYFRIVDKVCELTCDESKNLNHDKDSVLDISNCEYHCSVFELEKNPVMNKKRQSEEKVLKAIEQNKEMHKRFLEYAREHHPKFTFKDLLYLNHKAEEVATKKCHLGTKVGQKYSYVWNSIEEQFECSGMEELPFIIYCVLSGFFYIDNIEVLETVMTSEVEI